MGAEYYLKNDDLREYFISLPPIVQDQIVVSGAEMYVRRINASCGTF